MRALFSLVALTFVISACTPTTNLQQVFPTRALFSFPSEIDPGVVLTFACERGPTEQNTLSRARQAFAYTENAADRHRRNTERAMNAALNSDRSAESIVFELMNASQAVNAEIQATNEARFQCIFADARAG